MFHGITFAELGWGRALLVALSGYVTVFLMMLALVCVIKVISMVVGSIDGKKKAAAPAAPVAEVAAPVIPEAPGTAGQLKLHDVEPKTAAMVMAIVADKLGKPINELRFISIKEEK